MKILSIISFYLLLTSISALSQEIRYTLNGQTLDKQQLIQKLEVEFEKELNSYRLQKNLTTLTSCEPLRLINRQHSDYITSFGIKNLRSNDSLRRAIAHYNYTDRYQEMIKVTQLPANKLQGGGEIVQAAFPIEYDSHDNVNLKSTIKAILTSFINSPSHHRIIIDQYQSKSIICSGIAISKHVVTLTCNIIGVK